MPFNPVTGTGAKAGQPDTWGTFEQAADAVASGRYDGIGFEFHNNGIVGIDLDHVHDPATGEVQPWALEIVQRLNSYTEYSPSLTGLHIYVRGNFDGRGRKRVIDKDSGQAIEMYKEGRYFTVTGTPFLPAPIASRPEEVAALYAEHFKRAEQAHNSPVSAINAPEYLRIGLERDSVLRALWGGSRGSGDESSNDMALMNKLAFWCNRDEGQMIEAFLRSPHAAQKDEEHLRKLDRDDYLHRTATRAIEGCRETAADRDATYKRERARCDFAEAAKLQDFSFINPIDPPAVMRR